MKTLTQILNESDFADPKSPADKAFVDKHIIQKTDYPHTPKGGSNDEIFSGSKQKQHRHLADPEEGEEKEVYERSLTKGEERKKESIVKSMKKHRSDFISRYGKDGESGMHATATKMAKSEEELPFEAYSLMGHFYSDQIEPHEDGYYNHTLANGDEVEVDVETASVLRDVHDSLNEKNVKEFELAMATVQGLEQMIEFADSLSVDAIIRGE